MEVKSFEFNPFGVNTYIVYDKASRQAMIIDPGMMSDREADVIDSFIESANLEVKYLIASHIHIDHVAGVAHVEEKYGATLSAHQDDAFLASRVKEQAMAFHLPMEIINNVVIANPLSNHQVLHLGNNPLEILTVPGHSLGSVAIYSPNDKFVITGDALFKGSIGRTDLPGGDYATLINSITTQLMTLPDDTIVYPGHGPATTIREERIRNPYL